MVYYSHFLSNLYMMTVMKKIKGPVVCEMSSIARNFYVYFITILDLILLVFL